MPVGEAQVDLNLGAVQISQPLDFDASPDTTVGGSPALVYNSASASVQPIVQVTLTAGTVPQSVLLTLTWEGQTVTQTWSPPAGSQPGQTFLIDVQLPSNLAVTASGVYNWSLTAQASFADGSSSTATSSGTADVIVNTSSPYGSGWGLESTSRLVSDLGGDLLRIDGDGNGRLFSYNSSTGIFTSPAEDFGSLTGGLSLGHYLYTDKDQTEYYYDLNGRLTEIVQPNGWTLSYSYSAGRLGRVIAPDGGTTSLAYDGSGLLQNIVEPGSRSLTFIHSGADLTQVTDAAGYTRQLGYDGSHHLISDSWQPYDTTFVYDSTTGLLTSLTQSPVSYTIVSANAAQMVNANGQPLASYSYGANGNPTNAGDSVGTNNELLSDGSWSYSFDADGNLIGKIGVSGGPDAGLSWTYSYDADNQLTGTTETNGSQTLVQASYAYDAFGHRVQSSVALNGGTATVTKFAYNGDQLWATLDGSDALQTLYISGDQPDQFFAQYDTSVGVSGLLTDHLGSVRDVTNASGQVTDGLGYDAFGNAASRTDAISRRNAQADDRLNAGSPTSCRSDTPASRRSSSVTASWPNSSAR